MMFLVALFLCFAVFHSDYGLSLECEYSSREYQVVLRPSIMLPSFKTGVLQVLDELTKIEQAGVMDFKVSVSSLKYKNVSFTEYVSSNIRDPSDFHLPLRFKSRQKKVNEPADIVMKISNADPQIACWPLKINTNYAKQVSTKFELDIHAENGRMSSKTGYSHSIDLPMEFDQTTPIDISKYLVNAAEELTKSGRPLIVVPDHLGLVTMQTAEFDIRILGEKLEATIFLLQRANAWQTEFSFKIEKEDFKWDILLAAQKLIAEMSRIQSVAQFAV